MENKNINNFNLQKKLGVFRTYRLIPDKKIYRILKLIAGIFHVKT